MSKSSIILDNSDSDSQEFDEDLNESNNIITNDNIIEQDEMTFNIYNPENKEITIGEVSTILHMYGINVKPNNIELYRRAFVHKSYTKRPKLENLANNIIIPECPEDCLELKTKSNETSWKPLVANSNLGQLAPSRSLRSKRQETSRQHPRI